jgi:hypothetical protein
VRCQFEGRCRNYPDFLIVGAAKSGTSTLHTYLSRHPDVVMPPHKETLFFQIITNPNQASRRYNPYIVDNLQDYLGIFDRAREGQQCGESCPSYLYYHEHTIANLRRLHPRWQDVRIIIILREPVDKIISHYFYMKNIISQIDPALAAESLEECLRREPERAGQPDVLVDLLYVENTRYHDQVKAYVDVFPHVAVYLFEELKEDPVGFFRKVCRNLGLHEGVAGECCRSGPQNRGVRKRLPVPILGRTFQVLAGSKFGQWISAGLPARCREVIRNFFEPPEEISNRVRQHLKTLFREEVVRLARLTGLDLTRWGY